LDNNNDNLYAPNSDLHAYDNAHINEGVVYLHSANDKYWSTAVDLFLLWRAQLF